MENRIATSLEQSKKLIELGIGIDTADMYYSCGAVAPDVMTSSKQDYKCYTVCWSLSALLSLMPKLYEFENDPSDGGCQPNLCKGWDNNQWHIVYRSSIYITEWYDNPLDAAFEMICWLKENNKI